MQTGIGATLRQARSRREVELAEVEAATKIRVRYLRAMENEEWDVLPGDAYVFGFLRTYASFLGLDGYRLAEEHRRSAQVGQVEERAPLGEPVAAARSPWRGPRLPPRVLAAIVSAGLVAALVVIGLSGGDGGKPAPTPTAPPRNPSSAVPSPSHVGKRNSGAVVLALAATAEVWVCVLDGKGRPLVDGQILEAGAEEGPFRSGSFTVSLGNGEVSMTVDGREQSIPPSASPIGYSIDSEGALRELPEGERPTCE